MIPWDQLFLTWILWMILWTVRVFWGPKSTVNKKVMMIWVLLFIVFEIDWSLWLMLQELEGP